MNYSLVQLESLLHKDPQALFRILNNPNATVRTLSFGIELLGNETKNEDEELVLPLFRKLIKHVNAMVRESAVIGVSSFYIDRLPPVDILDSMKNMMVHDPSNNVREYIETVLKDFERMK